MLYKNWDMQYLRKPKTKNKLTAISQYYFKGGCGCLTTATIGG